MAPVNPARYGGTPGFRFRVARVFGYGAVARDDPPLPRARRPGADRRPAPHPARALRHEAGLHAGAGLVRRGAIRLSDPASWLVVEQGWEVVDAAGERVGTVDEVLGDQNADIFDGLAVATGLVGKPVYVPAERVGEITEGQVQLELTADAVERLEPYEPPAAP